MAHGNVVLCEIFVFTHHAAIKLVVYNPMGWGMGVCVCGGGVRLCLFMDGIGCNSHLYFVYVWYKTTRHIYELCFNDYLISGEDRRVKLWDLGMGSQIKELRGHTDIVHSLCFSPDSSMLASGMLKKGKNKQANNEIKRGSWHQQHFNIMHRGESLGRIYA